MNVDKTISTILLVLFLVIAIPGALLFRSPPTTPLPPLEKELAEFSNKPVVISPARQQTVFSGLDCPIKAVKKPAAATTALTSVTAKSLPQPKSNGAKPADTPSAKAPAGSLSSLPKVSMIYSEGDTKMAIIGGQMLHEGATFGRYQVVKIESTKVQLRSAGKDLWLNME